MTFKALRACARALLAALVLSVSACGGSDSPAPPVAPPEPSAPALKRANAFQVNLSPEEIVGQHVVSRATAGATLKLDRATGLLSGQLSMVAREIAPTAAHIHIGAPGTNGPIILSFIVNTVEGNGVLPPSAALTPAQVDAFDAGQLYVSVQTNAYPQGELRGQVGGRVGYTVWLSGEQTVPPLDSTGSGTGRLEFDRSTRVLTGEVNVTGLTPTAVNIRVGGPGTVGGAIIVRLEDRGGGRFEVPANTILDEGLWPGYFNVETAAYPYGEIRGAIGYRVFHAKAIGNPLQHEKASKAIGTGYLLYGGNSIAGSIRITGMKATAVHIHSVNGDEIALVENIPGSGVWHIPSFIFRGNLGNHSVTWDQGQTLLSNGMYFEAHSDAEAYPDFEIRGPILVGPPTFWWPS